MADKVTIIKALALLTGNWPKEPFTKERQLIYEEMLEDLPDEAVIAATKRCLAECTFFPAIAEIRNRAVDLLTAGQNQQSALEAWGQVVGMMRHTKHYYEGGELKRLPDRLDDMTERAVEAIGGWPYLRMSEDAMADRARFCEVYGVLQARRRQDVALLPEVRALSERMHIGAARRAPELEGER